MRNLLQFGDSSQHQSPRLRWFALLSILLIAIMSTVQVSHTHDLLPRLSTSHSSAPVPDTGPDHCPLCVAMHSALPATLQNTPEPVLLIHVLDSTAADAERIFRWRFQLASRPPPADLPRA
ncbi:hypothetical protein [Granulicella arctica]|uniref:hypothetical protein n=1 Tax=Granulicella arctica TaxID=940613 RepID=UPI0021E0669E|nr:hypothetical protein [Granulicella arctica]